MKVPDLYCGKRLFVGEGRPNALGIGEAEIRGSGFIEGPLQVGNSGAFSSVDATVMIGQETNSDNQLNPDRSVYVKGDSKFEGDGQTENAVYVTGPTTDVVYIDGDVFITGKVDCGNKGRLAARFAVADALGKTFDMVHPTKGKGWRLSYACVEGPEIGVYFRGRLKNKTEIELPYYWKDLVHEDSISVQLQPIGSHQDIIVKRWDSEKIYLQSKGGIPIDCFYHVNAERKDVNPLHVEYKGDSWKDYPDPNHLNKDPDDESRNLLDPQYRGPRNIITR
jgi:hypothetical protein